jgi:hypothetical protein
LLYLAAKPKGCSEYSLCKFLFLVTAAFLKLNV